MLADLFDLTGRAHAGKKWRKGYQRPWPEKGSRRTGGHRLSNRDALMLLASAKAGEVEWAR